MPHRPVTNTAHGRTRIPRQSCEQGGVRLIQSGKQSTYLANGEVGGIHRGSSVGCGFEPLLRRRAVYFLGKPKRLGGHHIKNTFPMTLLIGTVPQYRLSREFGRLSPMQNNRPFGILVGGIS